MAAPAIAAMPYIERVPDFLDVDFRSSGSISLRIPYEVTESSAAKSIGSSIILSLTRRRACPQWLTELKSLQQGWNSYGADAPSGAALERARAFLLSSELLATQPTSITASAEGGVAFLYSNVSKKRVLVEFLNSGEDYGFFYELGGEGETVMYSEDAETRLGFRNRIESHIRG